VYKNSSEDEIKPNSITLASSELAPNMFGASSELAPNQLVQWNLAYSERELIYDEVIKAEASVYAH